MRAKSLWAIWALGAAMTAHETLADPTGTSVPFGPNGDAVDGTSGQPVALTPTSLLVLAEGQDGIAGTADDLTLLVTGLGTAPRVTAIATPGAATDASRIERLNSARAVTVSSGNDATFGTADDAVLVLDRLGSQNAVTSVVLGGLGNSQQFTPERLSSDRFVIPSFGADLLPDTADDEVVVVTVAAPPVVQRLAAPFQRSGGRTRIQAVSSTVFLIASDGPNKKSSDGDDLVYLFRANATSFARTDLAAPGLNRRAAGRGVRLGASYALAVTTGVDFKDSTADDGVVLVDAVGGSAFFISVPFAKNGAAGRPTALGKDVAVVATMGADGIEGTADDAVAVISGIGSTNTVRPVVVGATGDNNECRPVRLDAVSFAMVTFGADRTAGTADDAVTIVQGVPGVPIVQHVVVGSIAAGSTSAVVRVSPGALLVAGGGADQVVGTPDDAVVALTGIRSTLVATPIAIGGALDSPDAFRFVPELLGGGRAALLSSGGDNDLGAGGDDAVRVVEGLPVTQSLDVKSLQAQFARRQGNRPSRVSVTAKLVLEDSSALTEEDLIVSIGNMSQTIPAGGLASFHGGRGLRYLDLKNARGFIRSLTYDLAKRTLAIDARGADADLASTAPGYVPVGIEIGGTLVPQSLTARPGRNGFVFRKKDAHL